MTGDKASSVSITKVVGCLLCLFAGDVTERHIVVVGGVARPLAVESSGGSVPEVMGGACYFSLLARQAASCG